MHPARRFWGQTTLFSSQRHEKIHLEPICPFGDVTEAENTRSGFSVFVNNIVGSKTSIHSDTLQEGFFSLVEKLLFNSVIFAISNFLNMHPARRFWGQTTLFSYQHHEKYIWSQYVHLVTSQKLKTLVVVFLYLYLEHRFWGQRTSIPSRHHEKNGFGAKNYFLTLLGG